MGESELSPGTVIALAGRRIDPVDAAQRRFPLDAVPRVRAALTALLQPAQVSALVCSAACGADLIALEVAGRAGIERHVVLPFEPAHFRRTSVTDRPGDWGPLFDAVIREVAAAGHLEVCDGREDDPGVYAEANAAILRRARSLAGAGDCPRASQPVAVVVWEGAPRGTDDTTAHFRAAARSAGFALLSPVLTVPPAGPLEGGGS
jgi:hypothetical protein